MEAITKYRADDGSEFRTQAECLAHEALCAEIAAVVATLPPLPSDDGCRFSNGHGFIQHDPANFYAARTSLLKIAQRVCPHKWIDQSLADSTVDSGWAGRIIGESSAPLNRAWYRVSCVDKNLREWGQPYYATHPDQGEQIRLNAA